MQDKIADQVSDAVLDACLAQDPDRCVIVQNWDFSRGYFCGDGIFLLPSCVLVLYETYIVNGDDKVISSDAL